MTLERMKVTGFLCMGKSKMMARSCENDRVLVSMAKSLRMAELDCGRVFRVFCLSTVGGFL